MIVFFYIVFTSATLIVLYVLLPQNFFKRTFLVLKQLYVLKKIEREKKRKKD